MIGHSFSTVRNFRTVCARSPEPTGSQVPSRPSAVRAALTALSLCVVALLCSHPAKAALGGGVATVETDRLQLRASSQRTVHDAFSVHLMTAANGTVVREYVSPAGAVFAVSWHGRVIPDLRQLLGAQFSAFSASQYRERGGLGHLVVRDAAQNPNLVVESNGRARSFHGRAYLNSALPAGVSINDIE
jgi:hypothetical protein